MRLTLDEIKKPIDSEMRSFEKKFQQRSTVFVDESFFEFFVGQDDVDEGEDVEVEEYGEQAQELIHELVLSIKILCIYAISSRNQEPSFACVYVTFFGRTIPP